MFTLESSIKSISVHLNSGRTIKDVASEIGINDRELSAALKTAGYRYEERKWLHENYEGFEREKPLSQLIKVKPVFNQRQIEKILQLIDSRLSYEKEINETYISRDIEMLGQIETIKKKVKVDKSTIELFKEYCLNNNLDQSLSLTLAIQNFLKQYQ